MEMIVEQRAERVFAGIRMVGPLDQNVGKGFQKLYQWIENNNVPESGDWMAIYYDNPEEVPPEEMRVDTVISVEPDFVLLANSEGVRIDTLKGGLYAVAQAHVEDGDFGRPWMEFFNDVLPRSGYVPINAPCFEKYHNDGTESGIWDFEMCVPVKKAEESA